MPEFTPLNKVEKMEQDELVSSQAADDEIAGGPVKAVNTEVDEDMGDDAADEKSVKKEKPKTPATPRKRGRKPAAAPTAAEDGSGEDDAEATTPSKKKRTTPAKSKTAAGDKKKAEQRPMPTSYENASPEDKMLLHMKDNENKPWAEIRQAWESMTGEKVGGSTLSGRYARIKANFVTFATEDETILLKVKKEIEDKFENEKWHRVAEAIETAGGNKYPPAAVQKKFKEMSKKMAGVNLDSKDATEAA
ncbi:hypothetical protein AJ80_05819 [Polytolypa hystricis UAMH7299]|uniref:Myb-like domain-containing protein n=1 Tax=Polytolypa hystricis (strain UAMH7299) TaxID=1447883 RepID=A0A2B7Y0Q6_POLH7|nr:hypothetical protein AJ80_05819 [Polytolypa hystricis UAMH7299]